MQKLTLSVICLLFALTTFGQQAQPLQPTMFFKATKSTTSTMTTGPLVVDSLASLQDVIATMFGPAVVVSNLTYTGAPLAIGNFQDTTGTLGMDSGIIMTSGSIYDAIGPNTSASATTVNFMPGDSLLGVLVNSIYPTYDAAVIEFDFVPLTDTIIACKMVFGSEEYPEFVGSNFNDVFGFFVSGPGFNGLENLAVADTNGTLLSINSINPNTNSQYYIDNTNGTSLQYDGFTTVIQFMRPVTNGANYHFKIAIADVADQSFDSGIFLKSKSFLSYAKMPSANFASTPLSGNAIQFSNITDYAKKYFWDFGDGTTDSVNVNPVHTYANAGDYTVSLKAVNYYQENTYLKTVTAGTSGINTLPIAAGMHILQLSAETFKVDVSNVKNASLQVFGVDGKKVFDKSSLNGDTEVLLDMSKLSKGMYIVKLSAGKESLTQKLIY